MKIFSIDNPIFKFISRIGDIFLLSFFWLLASVPIFTIGASTTAAYDCAFKIIRARDTNVLKDFIKSFKSNFKQSTIIFLILLPIGALILVDLYYWANTESSVSFVMNALGIGIGIIYLATLLFVFPVQAIFENPVKKTLQTAFLMSIKNWPVSLLLIVVSFGISYVCYVFPVAAYIFFIIGSGLFTMIYAVQFLTVFRKYNSSLEPDRPEECDYNVEIKKPKTVADASKVKTKKGSKIIK